MPFELHTFRCLSTVRKSLIEEPIKSSKKTGKSWVPGPSKDGFRVLIRTLKELKSKKEACGCQVEKAGRAAKL